MQIFEVTEGILKGVTGAPATGAGAVIYPKARAGFAKNAAEYLAKSALDSVGVPQIGQGKLDPTGHLAAAQGKGQINITQQQRQIANQLASEYLNKGQLNGKSVSAPTIQDFVAAVDLANRASYSKQDIDVQQTANLIRSMITRAQSNASRATKATSAAPAATKTKTGGKVPGQLSQTPGAIRKRQQRAAARAAAHRRGTAIKSPQPGAPTSAELANLEKRLQQALASKRQTT